MARANWAEHGWSPATDVWTHATDTGTSYGWDHGDLEYRVRIQDDGEVHLWINGAHYRLKGGASHETKKSFSTTIILTPVEAGEPRPSRS